MKHLITAITVTFVAVIALFAIKTLDHRIDVVEKLEPPVPLTRQQIRQAVWEGMRACGTSTVWNMKSMPDTYPEAEWCNAWHARLAAEEEERQRENDLEAMKDCIHEGGRIEYFEKHGYIDRVDKPRWHHSWVLSGECETLAHRLKKDYNLCLDWVDDDPETAETCRLEMKDYVETLCARDDIPDSYKRECTR